MLGNRLKLPKAFVAKKEECLVFLYRSANSQSVLTHTKGWNRRVAVEVEIIEVSSIEYGISEIAENRAVEIVGARLGHHINLTARLGAVLGIVEGGVDTVLLNCVLRNL